MEAFHCQFYFFTANNLDQNHVLNFGFRIVAFYNVSYHTYLSLSKDVYKKYNLHSGNEMPQKHVLLLKKYSLSTALFNIHIKITKQCYQKNQSAEKIFLKV